MTTRSVYRETALARDGYRCFRCGRPITGGVPSEAHHRLTRRFGPDTPDNLITLCGFGNNLSDADGRTYCHGWVHQNGREARQQGWVISRHDTRPPSQVPVKHWEHGMVLLSADAQYTKETPDA